MPTPTIPALSVVVMTYNEEQNLPRCLESVKGVGEEIFILDSFSTDRTVEIAKSFGARVEQHAFGSYVEQKKRLVQKAANDWVFCIDADEYLSDALRNSILRAKKPKERFEQINKTMEKMNLLPNKLSNSFLKEFGIAIDPLSHRNFEMRVLRKPQIRMDPKNKPLSPDEKV